MVLLSLNAVMVKDVTKSGKRTRAFFTTHMPTEAPSEPVQGAYEPKAPLSRATTTALQAGAVGAFVSAVQNALASHSAGAAGFLTRTGGTIGTFSESLDTTPFIFVDMFEQRQWALPLRSPRRWSQISERLTMHSMGSSAGVQLGSWPVFEVRFIMLVISLHAHAYFLTARSLPIAVGSCAVVGGAMATFDYAGQIVGDTEEKKEEKRKTFFKTRPIFHKPALDPSPAPSSIE